MAERERGEEEEEEGGVAMTHKMTAIMGGSRFSARTCATRKACTSAAGCAAGRDGDIIVLRPSLLLYSDFY